MIKYYKSALTHIAIYPDGRNIWITNLISSQKIVIRHHRYIDPLKNNCVEITESEFLSELNFVKNQIEKLLITYKP